MNSVFKKLDMTSFMIDNINIVSKTVIPPSSFVRKKNCVMHNRFFYVVRGKIIFNKNTDAVQEFSAGDIVYLPYDIIYDSVWDTKEEGEYIALNFMMFDKEGKLIYLDDKITLLTHDSSMKYLDYFKSIFEIWSAGGVGYRLKSKAIMYSIFAELEYDYEKKACKNQSSGINKALLYLENNYMNNITTSDLAAMCGIKECMFRRRFKESKGVSPMRYRNNLRLKKAYEMLSSGEFTVIETAIVTNFNDASFFNREFKKYYGINPTECIPCQNAKP